MADFPTHTPRAVAQVGSISISVNDYDLVDGVRPEVGIHYSIKLQDADGQSISSPIDTGSLRDSGVLTATQITAIENLMASLRTKAEKFITP